MPAFSQEFFWLLFKAAITKSKSLTGTLSFEFTIGYASKDVERQLLNPISGDLS